MTDVKTETPTVELTLAPTLDAAPVPTLANMSGDALAPASDAAEVPAKLDDSMLTERRKADGRTRFAQQIDVRDTDDGAAVRRRRAKENGRFQRRQRSRACARRTWARSAGFLADAVTELRGFDATEEKGPVRVLQERREQGRIAARPLRQGRGERQTKSSKALQGPPDDAYEGCRHARQNVRAQPGVLQRAHHVHCWRARKSLPRCARAS